MHRFETWDRPRAARRNFGPSTEGGDTVHADISEARVDHYLGHGGTTGSDRYGHRLRGQLEHDAAPRGGADVDDQVFAITRRTSSALNARMVHVRRFP
jgi:hypothetical protein